MTGQYLPGQDQGDGGLEAERDALQAVEEQQDAYVQLVTLEILKHLRLGNNLFSERLLPSNRFLL